MHKKDTPVPCAPQFSGILLPLSGFRKGSNVSSETFRGNRLWLSSWSPTSTLMQLWTIPSTFDRALHPKHRWLYNKAPPLSIILTKIKILRQPFLPQSFGGLFNKTAWTGVFYIKGLLRIDATIWAKVESKLFSIICGKYGISGW